LVVFGLGEAEMLTNDFDLVGGEQFLGSAIVRQQVLNRAHITGHRGTAYLQLVSQFGFIHGSHGAIGKFVN